MEAIASAITEALKPVVENLTAVLADIKNGKKAEEEKEEKPDPLSPGIAEFVKHATDPSTDPMKGRDLQ